ncbi:MAG: PEP-CTERM sorting domain-containing protein, partial [Verrucomicrobiota bacterium]
VDFGIQVNVSGDATQGLRLFVDASQFGYAVGTLDLSDSSTTFPPAFFGVQSTTLVLTYSESAETITATAFDGTNFTFVDSISTAGFGLTPSSEFAVSLVGVSTDTVVAQGGLAVTAGTFTLNQVPEPSTYAAIFGALALCVVMLRRRGTNAKAA